MNTLAMRAQDRIAKALLATRDANDRSQLLQDLSQSHNVRLSSALQVESRTDFVSHFLHARLKSERFQEQASSHPAGIVQSANRNTRTDNPARREHLFPPNAL